MTSKKITNVLVSEGAEAKVYSAKVFGKECIAKIRHEKKYRNRILDLRLRRSRTKREARIMIKAAYCGIRVPRLVAVSEFSIYMERLDGESMKDSKYGMEIMENLGKELSKMHALGISHGDFTPANVLLSNNSFYIIDFGLSEISQSMESKAIDLLLMKRSNVKHFSSFEKGYSSWKGSREILNRLKEIEKRGRYQARTLSTA